MANEWNNLRATRRRTRLTDRLADPEAVHRVTHNLRKALPTFLQPHETAIAQTKFKQVLLAVKHSDSYQLNDARRGRPAILPRPALHQIGAHLKELLYAEAGRHISIRTFVDHYLPILEFPHDIQIALTAGDINLFEAEQLARLNATNLQTNAAKAATQRAALLRAHLAGQESGARLRARVNEMIGPVVQPPHETNAFPAQSFVTSSPFGIEQANHPENFIDEILDDELELAALAEDPAHLFFDQLRQIQYAMAHIEVDDLTEASLNEILNLSDNLLSALARVRRRKQTRHAFRI